MDKKKLRKLFPYDYAGGGYFRERGIPVGVSAGILHGMEAIKYVVEQMEKARDQPQTVEQGEIT